MERIKESDEARMKMLYAILPLGYAAGPLQCPIGLDGNRSICSAGYCIGCQLDRHQEEMRSHIKSGDGNA